MSFQLMSKKELFEIIKNNEFVNIKIIYREDMNNYEKET